MTKGFVDAPGAFDIGAILAEREPERYALHTAHMNEQMVRVLQTIGYDVGFRAGQGQYLFDRKGDRYLDLLSGWGVFGIGRNHPTVRDALKAVLGSDLPNLIQMDVSVLSGVLAERLLAYTPWLDKVFFSNSGAEAVEAAIKFARCATGRPDIAYADHAFHGLSYGALSLTGDKMFRDGFGTLLPGCVEVPFNDLAALERTLSTKQVAAFIVEPIQGKGVNIPDDDYLRGVQNLCKKYGTLFVADEIQTGLGRTGKFLALEHWGVEPDMVLIAKALSGGHVPVGAVLATKRIFDKVFSRMDKAVVHGSTFAKNDMAMAAGLATLEVIERENLVANAAAEGRAADGGLPRDGGALGVREDGARQGADDRPRVRLAALAQAQGRLVAAGDGQRRPVLADHHDPDLQESQDRRAGRRPWAQRRQAAAAADDRRCRLRLDRERLRGRDRRRAQGAGLGVDARKDARRPRHEGARRRVAVLRSRKPHAGETSVPRAAAAR